LIEEQLFTQESTVFVSTAPKPTTEKKWYGYKRDTEPIKEEKKMPAFNVTVLGRRTKPQPDGNLVQTEVLICHETAVVATTAEAAAFVAGTINGANDPEQDTDLLSIAGVKVTPV
jgi:hypothetical protein